MLTSIISGSFMAQHLWQLVLFKAAHLNHKVKKKSQQKTVEHFKMRRANTWHVSVYLFWGLYSSFLLMSSALVGWWSTESSVWLKTFIKLCSRVHPKQPPDSTKCGISFHKSPLNPFLSLSPHFCCFIGSVWWSVGWRHCGWGTPQAGALSPWYRIRLS